MRFLRLLSLLLMILVGASSALLDSCVFGCRSHVHASAPETPPCHGDGAHDASASGTGGDRWTATAECGHDHAAISVDVVSQPRSGRADGAPGPFVAPGPALGAAVPTFAARHEFDSLATRSTRPAAFLSPLRL